jgi:Ca2+:H+ antiporter
MCLIGLIPLAGTISDVTDWIIQRSSPIFAGVLNAAFGNFPELIFGLFSLFSNEYEFLLAVCIGSVLSNTLLAMGLTIMVGHYKNPQNNIEKYSSIHRSGSKALFFATGAYMLSYTNTIANGIPSKRLDIVLSVMLIVVYIYNNWYTFTVVRRIENKDQPLINNSPNINFVQYFSPMVNFGSKLRTFRLKSKKSVPLTSVNSSVENAVTTVDNTATAAVGSATVIATDFSNVVINLAEQDLEDGVEFVDETVTKVATFAKLKVVHTWFWIIVTLLYATVVSAILTDGITMQIAELSVGWGLSPRFIGGVLVATVGNICEYWSALVSAYKGDIDTGLQISLSSSLQILLFLIPLFVIGTSQREEFLYMGSDPILIMPLFLTSIIIPFTLFPTLLDMYGGVALVAFYAMISALFYVN